MIYLASDHVGLELKNFVKEALKNRDIRYKDLGPQSPERVDYTDFAKLVCQEVRKNKSHRGILICGTGIGMSMMANRYKRIRAAVCVNEYMAKMAREHNDANILCIGSRVLGNELAISIVLQFLNSTFVAGRHLRRVEKMDL